MIERYTVLRLYYAKCHDGHMHEGQIINPKTSNSQKDRDEWKGSINVEVYKPFPQGKGKTNRRLVKTLENRLHLAYQHTF